MSKQNLGNSGDVVSKNISLTTKRSQWRAIIKVETIAILREPSSIFFIFILPLVLTVVFGSAFGDDINPDTGVRGINQVFPINVVFLIANIGLIGIPVSISELREKGTLKRYFSYPISYMTYFFSVMITYIVVSILSSIAVIATSFIFFGATFQMNFIQVILFLLFWLLSTYIFYGLGYVIVLFFKSSRTTNIASTAVFLAMIVGSGVAIPVDSLPESIQKVAEFTPMAHAIQLLEALWLGQEVLAENLYNIGYLSCVALILTVIISNYRMRWEA
jgi:ABC-2 type transport system permease protein